jgi:two-component system response regulator MprA
LEQADPLRVLVVDDEAPLAKMMRKLLEVNGYTVEVASDGQAALEAVGTFRPHVVVLDVMMPKENGYRVSRKIKMLGRIGGIKTIPKIIIVTARDLSHDKEREEGMTTYSMADGFLYKPFKLPDLLSEIRRMTVSKTPALAT